MELVIRYLQEIGKGTNIHEFCSIQITVFLNEVTKVKASLLLVLGLNVIKAILNILNQEADVLICLLGMRGLSSLFLWV